MNNSNILIGHKIIKPQSKRKTSVSSREMEVLYLIAYEHTNQEIADKLFLSKGTIATHRNNLLTKLNTKNTAGLVRRAFEIGILLLNSEGNIGISSSY